MNDTQQQEKPSATVKPIYLIKFYVILGLHYVSAVSFNFPVRRANNVEGGLTTNPSECFSCYTTSLLAKYPNLMLGGGSTKISQ